MSHLNFPKNSPKLTIFGIFDEIFCTQNVNIARFPRYLEWDFFYDFKTLCSVLKMTLLLVLTLLIIFFGNAWKVHLVTLKVFLKAAIREKRVVFSRSVINDIYASIHNRILILGLLAWRIFCCTSTFDLQTTTTFAFP